jgi:hypothetical protein
MAETQTKEESDFLIRFDPINCGIDAGRFSTDLLR